MSENVFKASNGLVISEIDEGDYMVTSPSGVEINVDPWQSKALREYFRHERDTELGRVRWPEDPDYVIYRYKEHDEPARNGRCITVFRESNGEQRIFWESKSYVHSGCPFKPAADWYFTEGPGKEPERPWEDAERGEIWWLTVYGEPQNAIAEKDNRGDTWFTISDTYISAADPDITAGRKLLNADGSMADE